jgi:hypothetical protein
LAQSSAGSLRCGAPSGSGTTSSTPTTTTANPKVDQFNAIKQQEDKNQQAIQQAGDSILNLFQMFHTSKPDTQLDRDDAPAPDPAAAAAAQQQIINAEAADLLASANSLLPSQPSAEPSTQPDSNAAVSALLDENTPSNTATAAVSSLLGDAAPLDTGATSTATAVAGLLDDSTQPADANSVPPPPAVNPQDPNRPSPGNPFYQSPMPDKSQWYTPPTPLQDSVMNADLQDSVDQPNPSMFDTLRQQLQSGVQTVKDEVSDGLNSLVTSGKSLLAPIMNDPGLQAIYHVVSNGGATMPLTTPTDSGDTMFRNVAGQAWLGSTDMIKNGPVAGRYSAGTKMIDQNSAYMGWAQADIPTISGGTQP